MFWLVAAAVLSPQNLPVEVGPGSLIVQGKPEAVVCPLKNTDVKADIAGFGARVTVVQTFTNPTREPIEAVYTFPLPHDAAVDRMTMKLGDRTISGVIKRREEARVIYEAAKNQGKASSLLDQERPNIFRQSVANILPGEQVRIEISYVQILKYENGQFEFSYPMVVAPRFLGNAPDPEQISAPITPKGTRTGANIDLSVNIDAGAPLTSMKSVLHDVRVDGRGVGRATVALRKKDEIPNRDFVLRYSTATDSVGSALLAKYDPVKGGYFSLVLLPPKAPTQQQIAPKEVVFVMDQSGSQSGFAIEKSKELTNKLIARLNPADTFNVYGFSNSVTQLWKEPRPNTPANRAEATKWVSAMEAQGGTQFQLAAEAALKAPADPARPRLVVFNTDGLVGDEKAILKSIADNRGHARMFMFGIGNSTNRYLIEEAAAEGKGDFEVVTVGESADPAVERFLQRTQNPILLNVGVSFSGVEVTDQLPQHIPDVFGDKPIVLYGRYATPGRGKVTITGTMAGKPWRQTVDVMFPSDKPGGESIPSLWARRMVDKIERETNLRLADRLPQEGVNMVTDLALEYGIMSQYTSFVAVEERVINVGGKQRKVHVPIEKPDGMSDAGVYGDGFSRGRANLAGGGFGGGAAGAPASAPAKRQLAVRHADPSDLGVELSESELKQMTAEARTAYEAARKKANFEGKVAKPLREARGEVEVQIWVSQLTDELKKELKDAGFKLDLADGSLKVVFGTCDAKALVALAQIKGVARIEPLS